MHGSLSQVLDYSWDYVTSLFWARYPNPFASHVLHEDVLERRLIDDHTLYTKRIIVKRGFGKIPFWLRKLLANRKELIVEESIIDLGKREILTRTRNFGGLARYAVLTEDCRYVPMLRDPSSTQIDRYFVLQSSLGVKILHPLWSFLKRRYTNSAERSLQGYRFICQQFAGQLDSHPNTVLSPSKIACRLKDFALNKRPRLLLAQAGSKNSD
ncbi:px19 protein [Echinococcus multilocularis]|uniref:Px19 protein n=1 Tax=Echinococcus multilocularis TaxID=6211 RepID=A0A068Y1H2_ECHMU|nr:px19 protein [Echinococcus multilocularis]